MKSNIIIIGFISTGKSAVGKALGERLDRKVIDIDQMIHYHTGKSPGEIFEADGEITFREMEIEHIKWASRNKNIIISLGGGAVVNRINIDRLKLNGTVFLLTATLEEIIDRTACQESRPILDADDREEALQKLWEERSCLWGPAADVFVDTSDKSVDDVVEEILGYLDDMKSK